MKKQIKDVTFEEFIRWCNSRLCDDMWSYKMAVTCLEVIKQVTSVKSLFGKKKKREKKWNEIKGKYFVLETEIEVR